MKILITGANGMLAKAVKERFKNHELILTDVEELDITNLEKVEEFVVNCKPEVIINCAAYTAVDNAEDDLGKARKINAIGPKNLAIAANKNNCKLVHVSTDYVFDGTLDVSECYEEDDECKPVTAYGITKLEGENAIKENTSDYYIFRTAWLFGDGKNFVKTMLGLGKKQSSVAVVCDQHGSPTYTEDLADAIYQALEKEIPYGIYHATNFGYTTWCDFTKKIFEYANIYCEVNPVTSDVFVRPAKRPENSKLSTEKLEMTGIRMPSWEHAIFRYLKTLDLKEE